MTQIPLGIGAYSRPYGKLPEIRMENRFFEQNPVGAEQVALLSRPGTREFLTVGDGPIRALFSQYGVFDGDLFIVSGEALFRYSGGLVTAITGTIAGSDYPTIASVAIPGWEAIFISDGVSLQYYDGPAGIVHELKACVVPDGVPIADLVTINSYVLAAQDASRKFFYIPPGDTDIDALNFYSMEAEPDQIVNMAVVGDQLWIFGQSSSEVWYPTGDAEDPFSRAQGRAFSQGILPGTFAKLQGEIFLVGQDRVAYRIAGSPEPISHHGIAEMLRGLAETAADVSVALSYTVVAERTVQFTGSAAAASPVVEYAWDYGDGSPIDTVSGATPQHVYAALGSYVATLTVTLADGRTGSVQRTISVATLLTAPLDFAGVWSRTAVGAEQIALTWTDPSAYTASLARKVYRNGVEVADLAAGVLTFNHTNAHATVPLAGEVENNYTVKYYVGADEGVTAAITVWSGPLEPSDEYATTATTAYEFFTGWVGQAPVGSVTELYTDYLCFTVFALKGTYARTIDTNIRVGTSALVEATAPEAQSFSVRIRSKYTSYGVDDFSRYVTLDAVVEGQVGEVDGYQSCP